MRHAIAPAPDDFNVHQLRDEVEAIYPGCLNVAGYGDDLVAIYEDDDACPTDVEFGLIVSEHVPAALTPDPLHLLAAAIVSATSLDDLRPAAESILTDGDS
jgi:hypothetical protein